MNVLVIGRAKTGTTIIAKTIQNSLENASLLMEPKTLNRFLDRYDGDMVVKIIFEHWSGRPHARDAILHNELALTFDRRIAIVRDPRDELISRMFYVVYGHLKSGQVSRADLAPWLALVREKERLPQQVAVADMLALLNRILGIHMSLNMQDSLRYFEFINRQSRRLHVLRYEDFIAGQVAGLESCLGFPLVREREVGSRFHRTLRSAAANNWKAFFLPADLAAFQADHADAMAAMGYHDWLLEPLPALNPAHGSEYLERLCDDAERRLAQPEATLPDEPSVST